LSSYKRYSDNLDDIKLKIFSRLLGSNSVRCPNYTLLVVYVHHTMLLYVDLRYHTMSPRRLRDSVVLLAGLG